MVELPMDSDRVIDITNDPITAEIVFEFKEKSSEGKLETKAIQRIPIRVIANWEKILYHELDERIYAMEYDDHE